MIRFVETKDIVDFCREENQLVDGSMIISPPRAQSLAANPKARPEDPALILAELDGQYVGSHCLLWDRLYYRGKFLPMVWSNASYVHPDFRGKGIIAAIYEKTCSLGVPFGAFGMTAQVQRLLKATGLAYVGYLHRFESSPFFAFTKGKLAPRLNQVVSRTPFCNSLLQASVVLPKYR